MVCQRPVLSAFLAESVCPGDLMGTNGPDHGEHCTVPATATRGLTARRLLQGRLLHLIEKKAAFDSLEVLA